MVKYSKLFCIECLLSSLKTAPLWLQAEDLFIHRKMKFSPFILTLKIEAETLEIVYFLSPYTDAGIKFNRNHPCLLCPMLKNKVLFFSLLNFTFVRQKTFCDVSICKNCCCNKGTV
jgi:hypothetical protein